MTANAPRKRPIVIVKGDVTDKTGTVIINTPPPPPPPPPYGGCRCRGCNKR